MVRSRVTILGVVPLATSEWKPLMAPHAMVMKQKGNRLPATTGRMPPVKLPGLVSHGIFMGGRTIAIPAASMMTTPIFKKVTR